MTLPRKLILVWASALASLGASYRTTNFVAEAPTPQIAQQIGQAAEHYRKEKAIQWLGYEMPPWSEPCPIHAKVTMSGAGGATSFAFEHGQVLGQNMNIEGSLDRLLSSVLPHEVTHTVFAFHFRRPLPRWADEGGSVLSEDDAERNRHDMLCRQILNTPGRAMPLRRLFALREYPNDVMCLYAQGFSVTNFLVGMSNRQTFLNFIAHGMNQGWDSAAQTFYRYRTVDELEQAWLAHLRATKGGQPAQVARNTNENNAGQRVVVRQTAPPAQPLEAAAAPVFRGANPADYPLDNANPGAVMGRPTATSAQPAAYPAQMPAPPGWSPIPPQGAYQPPAVQLGTPRFGTP